MVHHIFVSEHIEVEFQLGTCKDKVVSNVMPMDVFHVLLGRPWHSGKKVTHDGRRNCYIFEKDGVSNFLLLLQEGDTVEQHITKVL